MDEFNKFVAVEEESLTSTSLYSRSPQPYYVTRPSLVVDNDDDYQGEIQGDSKKEKLITAIMLLARAITPTLFYFDQQSSFFIIKHKESSCDTRWSCGYSKQECWLCREWKQECKEAKYESSHYARKCPKHRVCDAKYFREKMLLVLKDEVGVHLNDEKNDYMLDNAYGDNTLEELNAAEIIMVRIQPTDDKLDVKPTYDGEFISELNALHVDMINGLLSKSGHEQRHHEKLKTIIHTSADDQIASDIIFDDPLEAEKQRKKNIELQKQKALLQRELETCKEWVKEFENKNETTFSIQREKERTVRYDEQNEIQKYFTNEKLICVTPLNNNKDLKAMIFYKVEVKIDKSKPVTSCSTPKNDQGQKKNANVIARGMYKVTKIETNTPVAKTNKFSCNFTKVASSSGARRPESKV
nr:hypothetical protein [Tanacetum cinerariifolium]